MILGRPGGELRLQGQPCHKFAAIKLGGARLFSAKRPGRTLTEILKGYDLGVISDFRWF